MKRRGPKRTAEESAREASKDGPRTPSSGAGKPNFWDELYWFTVICLGGWILALAVLPPVMVRLREAREFEAECRQRVEDLTERNVELSRVVDSFETDELYREEVIRTILGVKKQGEVFLK